MKSTEGKFAWTVKVGEKGQFVIPKEAREVFHIQPGDTLIVLGDVEKGLAIPPKHMLENLTKTIFSPQQTGKEQGNAGTDRK